MNDARNITVGYTRPNVAIDLLNLTYERGKKLTVLREF